MQFRMVIEGKTGGEIPELPRLKVLENISLNFIINKCGIK